MNKDYLTSPLNDEYSKQLRELREKVINSPGMKIMLEKSKADEKVECFIAEN